MGYPTKVQLIKRKASEQWYINFPAAIAQAMEFQKGEVVEWIIEDRSQLVLNRLTQPPTALKKKRRVASSKSSKPSGAKAGAPSSRKGSSNARKPSR